MKMPEAKMTWREAHSFFVGLTDAQFDAMPDEEKMGRRWKMPQPIPADQYSLWALERILAWVMHWREQCPDSVEARDAVKLLTDIITPMREEIEKQGRNGWNEFMNRHSGSHYEGLR